MSSQVLRRPLDNYNKASDPTTSAAHLTSLNESASTRPRRAAAIASEAAIAASSASTKRRKSDTAISNKSSASSSSTTLPRTPTQQSYQSGGPVATASQVNHRPMAALPRAKRARRDPAPYDSNGINGLNHHDVNRQTYLAPSSSTSTLVARAPAPASKGMILSSMNSALNGRQSDLSADHHEQRLASSTSIGSGMGGGSTVREMINGRERDVFVLDSASPPAMAIKGKRKDPGTPVPAGIVSNSDTNLVKRRRKDEGNATHLTHSASLRNLYTGNGNNTPLSTNQSYLTAAQPDVEALHALQAGAKAVPSYRGGYLAGNQYYRHAAAQRPATNLVPTSSTHRPAPPPQPVRPTDDAEGHFNVHIGDFVTSRYCIEGLLGQGTFGKVVQCRDLITPRLVAIKVIRAVQKYTDAAQIEIRVLKTLREHDPWNENKCIHLLETFTYRNHVCIVSELLGKSVFDFLKENDFQPFPPRHIWSFAKSLLKSVAFLHSLGLIHTDLKPENILLVNSDFKVLQAHARSVKKKRVLQDTDIRLIDFGSATFDLEYHSQVVSTRHYRAPEIILQMGWSYPCDAWSIGCILIEFYTGEALFQTHDNLEHLAMMEAVLGNMPDNFRRKAETFRPNYFRDGRLAFPQSTTSRQSKSYVKKMKRLEALVKSPANYSKHDERFRHLLKRLLTFDPDQRVRVDQALSHPYFALAEHEIPP